MMRIKGKSRSSWANVGLAIPLGATLTVGSTESWAGSLAPDGQLALTVSVRGIPQAEDLTHIEEQIRVAQMYLCNATDGLVRLTNVKVTSRPASEQRSDVWWYPNTGRENATVGGLEIDSGRVLWFGTAAEVQSSLTSWTIVQERPGPTARYDLTGATLAHELGHYVLGIGDEYAQNSTRAEGWRGMCGQGQGIEPGFFSLEAGSMMAGAASNCVNQDGNSHEQIDPVLSAIPCLTDADCTMFNSNTMTWTCRSDPSGRELSVESNFDTVLSPWRYGGTVDVCPAPRAATDLHLHARIRVDQVPPIDLMDFPGNPEGEANAWLGRYSARMPLIDALGEHHKLLVAVIKYQTEPTAKVMVVVAAPREDYGGTPPAGFPGEPDLFEVARFAVGYDGNGLPVSINGVSLDASGNPTTGTFPEIRLGDSVTAAPFGSETDGATGQVSATSPFANGAPPVNLKLHLENIVNVDQPSQAPDTLGYSSFILSSPRVGLVASRYESNGLPPQGMCDDPTYCFLYDSLSGQYQGTSHTRIQLMFEAQERGIGIEQVIAEKQALVPPGELVPLDSGWQSFYERYGVGRPGNSHLTTLGGFIAPKAAADPVQLSLEQCGPPGCGAGGVPCETQVTFEDITVPDQFVLVLDRSGSMATPMPKPTAGTRLDFAKAASRAIVAAFKDNAAANGTQMALVSFDDEASLDANLQSTPAQMEQQVNGLATDGGFTAITLGLDLALTQLEASPMTGAKAILLLSDGENNRPCDCLPPEAAPGAGCAPPNPGACDPAALPEAAARRIRDAGVQLYTAPVGEGADRTAYASLAESADGAMFDSAEETEVIPNFMLAYVAFRGGQPLLSKAESFVQQRPPRVPRPRQMRTEESFPLQVEVGASNLQVMLSVRNSDPAHWAPRYELRDGQGQVVATEAGVQPGHGATMAIDSHFHLVSVAGPGAGAWELRVLAPATGSTQSYLTAYVENPFPDCFADVAPGQIVAEGQPVTIYGSASQGIPLASGSIVSGELRRPDGTTVPLDFSQDLVNREQFRATVPPSAWIGQGTYSAEVHCAVLADATPVEGEGTDAPNERLANAPFERTAKSQFFLASVNLPPLSGPDTDGDGILDGDEQPGDLDGDGLDNVRDSDSDGDEVVDGLDPDPWDGSNSGRQCTVTPEDVGCCTDPSRCAGAANYVLYALHKLHMSEGSYVDTGARVASVGTESTQLGVNASCGDMFSKAPVLLQNYSHVAGDVLSSGAVDSQFGATVAGGVSMNTPLSLPRFDNFWIELPDVPPGNEVPDLGQVDNLEPGRYGTVMVEDEMVLHLYSGSYFLDDFHVEPGARLEFDPSQGPVFLYIGGRFTFRGEQAGVDPSELLAVYLGTEPVALERDFSGTVVAPYAQVNIGPNNEGARIAGAVFASRIFVQPNVEVIHAPFPMSWARGANGLSQQGPCANGALDGTETDVDCGGNRCSACPDGGMCLVNADCQSNRCSSGECVPQPPPQLSLSWVPASNWGAGYCGNLRVRNTGTVPVSSWTAVMNMNGTAINNHWNLTRQGSTGSVTFYSLPPSGVIAPGATNTQAGLCATRPSGGNAYPTVVSISGQP